MNDHEIPADAPPPYSESPASSTLKPIPRNGIPPEVRRSMEDERRDLPQGWVRQLDPIHHHHFYVDTSQDPPRSIWHHPLDDEQYLSTLSHEERERIQQVHRVPTKADLEAESTDEEDEVGPSHRPNKAGINVPSTHGSETHAPQKQGLGRKLKDKLTGTTHEEREATRRQRAEQERQYYEQHRKVRLAMARAMETGEPQLIGHDAQGHSLYIEPPMGPGGRQMYGYPGAGLSSRYSPYASGIYQDPNARFIRPPSQYQRQVYGGYGGGLGLPLAAGLGGGLLFGGLLGAGL